MRRWQRVEDPTNQDEQFTRNRIRAQLLPALDRAFPQFRDTFARSAAHAAEAQEILDEVACDLAALEKQARPASRPYSNSAQPASPWCCVIGLNLSIKPPPARCN
jgi:tRNA(Ile)-lysidine synthase TilS/MesJ